MEALDLKPADLSGILITHEHSDHIGGLAMMTKYFGLPVYAPGAVARSLCKIIPEIEEHLRPADPGREFALGYISGQKLLNDARHAGKRRLPV